MSLLQQAWAWLGQYVDKQILIDLLLTGITIFPLCVFFILGWRRRAREIATALRPEAKCLYLNTFQEIDCTPQSANAEFDRMYREWYGRSHYAIPILLVIVVSLYQNFHLAGAIKDLLAPDSGNHDKIFNISVAAIAGAYTFVTWDFFMRMQQRNLAIVDVLGGVLRMVMAIPIGHAVAKIDSGHGVVLAFMIAAFPVETILTISRRLANRWLKLEIGADTSIDQVKTLAGVDAPIADRIASADITTITQLAWCDPIQLTMRTNLQFSFILDIVSQALAWVYFEKRLERLRPLGLRGAVEIRTLVRDIKTGTAAEKKTGREVLTAAAHVAAVMERPTKAGERQHEPKNSKEKLSVAGLYHAFDEIAFDPSTKFLSAAWTAVAQNAAGNRTAPGARRRRQGARRKRRPGARKRR